MKHESISSLSGNVAFITGASDGMGKATSFFLSSLGVNVVLCACRKDLLEQYAAQIQSQFRTDPLVLSLDVTKVEEISKAVEEATMKFGMIHFVCNFAGYSAAYGMREFRALNQNDLLREEIQSKWKKELALVDDIDHKGTVRVNDAIQPLMKEQGEGVILNISAITSVYNYPYEAAYVNAKHANEEDAANRAKESDAKGWGIRAYSIAPGDVYTSTTWDAYDENEKVDALGYGIIKSETIAKTVSWLLEGTLNQKWDMQVDLETSRVSDEGRLLPLRNGDVVVVDAKTAPKLYALMDQEYYPFVPRK